MNNVNLLSSTSHVETPFIAVTIGEYTFGVYDKITQKKYGTKNLYNLNRIKYPNYIKALTITKLNGKVNNYSLNLEYTITEEDDPNFFEKVFSSVSKSRKIIFSYGDLSLPNSIYRDEEAIIMKVSSSFDIASSKISYTVTAISNSTLLTTGAYTFRERFDKPSNIIRELLYNESYGLLNIFPGMRDIALVDRFNLIPDNDIAVNLDLKTNISILDYLSYLVNNMTASNDNNIKKDIIYILTIADDTSGTFNGPYFKIVTTDRRVEDTLAYVIDIGYPSQNAVIDFNVENDETYSILYDYQEKLNPQEYVQRINNRGEIEEIYAPILSSGNEEYETREEDKSWWSKITEYPIKCSITLKGLLKPALLMTHVKLNVIFFGKKHIASGLYAVTKQQDSINESGFKTTLNLLRISGD